MHPQPDIIRDPAQRAIPSVEAEQRAELVLEVVAAAGFEGDAVEVEPGAPEGASEEGDVPAGEAAGEVAEGEVDAGLGVEVDDAEDALGREEGGQGVDDGVVVGLSSLDPYPHPLIEEGRLTIMERLYDMVTSSAPPCVDFFGAKYPCADASAEGVCAPEAPPS